MKFSIAKLGLAATLSFTLSACVIHVGGGKAQRADVELSESLEIDATTLRAFDIDAGAGDLSIVGVDGQSTIKVEAQILTTKARDYQLTLRKNGDEAELIAIQDGNRGSWIGSSPYIHLFITMPSDLALNIEDGSGDITIDNVLEGVLVDDGSGNILVKNVSKSVTIDDGSGNITLTKINGDVNIEDGSGEIEVTQIQGDVVIDDSSGNLNVYQASGMVTIDDGSGNIDVNTAGGLTIINSGSGGLSISGVKGYVSIDD